MKKDQKGQIQAVKKRIRKVRKAVEDRGRKKAFCKVYCTNADTIGLNVVQFSPIFEVGKDDVDPRLLRKKGTRICR